MNKIKFLFIILVMIVTFNFSASTFVFADEEVNNSVSEEEQKEEVLNLIKDYLSAIDKKIVNIDAMVENSRKQEEFDYYPAIRLDIDTPLFGLLSLSENKLVVKKDISTSDIANKYSIRDIVRKNKIRLPDSYLGAIVVSTKEYSIDEKMTLSQLRMTLVKCIQYLSQADNAEKYTQSKINRTYKDYISEDKKTSLREIKEKCTKLEQNLVTVSDKILISAFIGVDMTEYTKRYTQIVSNINTIKEAAKNSLIIKDELSELTKSSNTAETNVIDLSTDVDKVYQNALYDMEYEKFVSNVYSNIKTRYELMDKYISNAKKEVKTDKGEGEEKKENEEEILKEEQVYEVTSLSTRDYLKIVKEDLETKIKELEEQENTVEKEQEKEELNKELTKEELEAKRTEKIKENEEKAKNIYGTYKDVVNREYNFYTNNINMLLKDSNSKISSIIDEIDNGIDIDKSVFDYIKYIYLDLPTNLTKYIDNNNLKSTLELNNLVSSLKVELNNLATTDYNLSKIYSEIIDYLKRS